ncbi:MAG: OmpA family protein [Syntrophobacteraceae bacterium]
MPGKISSGRSKRCLLLVLGVLIQAVFLLSEAQAQQSSQPQLGLVFNVLDLKTRVLDLKFQVEDLKGAAQEVKGPAKDIKGAVEGLAMKETSTEVKFELSGDILFDFDKWNIRREAEPTLARVAGAIRQYRSPRVLVEGFTDAKGSDSYNLRLSRERAESVRNWLIRMGGVDEGKLNVQGWGKQRPVAPNTNPDGSDNPAGRQKNRRVEITVKKG